MPINIKTANKWEPDILYLGAITGSDADYYTVPSGKTTQIKAASMHNTTGATVNVSLSVVPASGTLNTAKRLLTNYALAGGDTLNLDEIGLVESWLGPGALINAKGSTGVNLYLNGIVVSPS